jgi:hypothetical protein
LLGAKEGKIYKIELLGMVRYNGHSSDSLMIFEFEVRKMIQTPYSELDDLLKMMGETGLMARSDVSIKRAGDRIECLAAAAKYEYLL